MNQREYTILSRQLENINRTLSIVENSNVLISQMMNNMNSENSSRRRSTYRYNRHHNNMNTQMPIGNLFNNNDMNTTNTFTNVGHNNDNNNDNTQTYVLRFDTLIPSLANMISNIRDPGDVSYNYRIYNYENNDVSLDEIVNDYDLINVKYFELIENPINDICPITRDRFYNTQNVMMISSCKHIFNKSSLNIWIQNNNTCPSCRSTICNRNNVDLSNNNTNNNMNHDN